MSVPPSRALDLLSRYAEVHRDTRNIRTHLFGIPLIVLALSLPMAQVELTRLAGLPVTLGVLALGLSTLWYAWLGHAGLTLGVTALNGLLAWAAHHWPIGGGFGFWASVLLLLGIGMVLQAQGHRYEGRKPAFIDDLRALMVGPLFVALHLGHAMGLYQAEDAEIDRRAGPKRSGVLPQPMH